MVCNMSGLHLPPSFLLKYQACCEFNAITEATRRELREIRVAVSIFTLLCRDWNATLFSKLKLVANSGLINSMLYVIDLINVRLWYTVRGLVTLQIQLSDLLKSIILLYYS